jgi:hypothetical protein
MGTATYDINVVGLCKVLLLLYVNMVYIPYRPRRHGSIQEVILGLKPDQEWAGHDQYQPMEG